MGPFWQRVDNFMRGSKRQNTQSWAIELSHDKGCVVFALDYLFLVQRLNASVSLVSLVVSDIKHLVSGFTLVPFCHLKRVLNEAVHFLAKSYNDVNFTFIFHSGLHLSSSL
jgi:hypothetical protein